MRRGKRQCPPPGTWQKPSHPRREGTAIHVSCGSRKAVRPRCGPAPAPADSRTAGLGAEPASSCLAGDLRAAPACAPACGSGERLQPSRGGATLLGRLLVGAAGLHLTENALALHLLLQRLESLIGRYCRERIPAMFFLLLLPVVDNGKTRTSPGRGGRYRMTRFGRPKTGTIRSRQAAAKGPQSPLLRFI